MRDKHDKFNPENHEQDCDYCKKCDSPMWDDWNDEPVDYCSSCDECEVTCCNIEITQEIKDIGLCPECLEHI
jgi:hypothetical protein